MLNFLIVITGFNCASFVKPCINSVLNQKKGDWTAFIVVYNDASFDGTQEILTQYKNITILKSNKNIGATYGRNLCIKTYGNPDDVVILLGLDDQLLPNCLNTIADKYKAGAWVTYGNWINQSGNGLPENFELDFDQQTHQNRDYRKVKYRSTAPNTFKTFLFNAIPEQDFKINNKWIDTTTESEVMFSCLEMAGEKRIAVIKEPIYLYNQNLSNGTQRRLGQAYKNEIYNIIINRPKKELYENIKY